MKTSETLKLLGKPSNTLQVNKDDSDDGLDFVGQVEGKLDIKQALEKGKLSFAEKFGKTIPAAPVKSVKGMFLSSGVDLKRKKVE